MSILFVALEDIESEEEEAEEKVSRSSSRTSVDASTQADYNAEQTEASKTQQAVKVKPEPRVVIKVQSKAMEVDEGQSQIGRYVEQRCCDL